MTLANRTKYVVAFNWNGHVHVIAWDAEHWSEAMVELCRTGIVYKLTGQAIADIACEMQAMLIRGDGCNR